MTAPRIEATLLDIVLACRDIEEFAVGISEGSFLQDESLETKRARYAILHELLVIGEAVKRLPGAFRDEHGEVPWTKIAGMRDRLMHRYDDVDFSIVWNVVREEIPSLRRRLEPLLR